MQDGWNTGVLDIGEHKIAYQWFFNFTNDGGMLGHCRMLVKSRNKRSINHSSSNYSATQANL